jgi:hypothetical protein
VHYRSWPDPTITSGLILVIHCPSALLQVDWSHHHIWSAIKHNTATPFRRIPGVDSIFGWGRLPRYTKMLGGSCLQSPNLMNFFLRKHVCRCNIQKWILYRVWLCQFLEDMNSDSLAAVLCWCERYVVVLCWCERYVAVYCWYERYVAVHNSLIGPFFSYDSNEAVRHHRLPL